ncbi:LytR/AlgR family response regulator transcription factor [Paracnuella aquatica]|uniref:LytR/AlgR family response regulator transcription factor n=1 Tax=Paracnuella aquatica TaxID=2268757 RepID=UPI000DEF5B1A|nr:LytTR family DNA-binding domain-containing protein [Paracnuella aquatica]RPD44248.1 DNA-binding response regulator [Paracnuella aquatica]
MSRIVIIEDEKAVSTELVRTLKEVAPDVEVEAVLTSMAQAMHYLLHHPAPDLILSDVQLPDGISFHIFQQVPVAAPVIFITGYDKFMLSAFAHNGIDYLLKPVCADDLEKALQKYRRLQQHFNSRQLMEPLLGQLGVKKRNRILVKRGVEYVSLPCADLVLCYTENKLVYVLDKCGKKYLSDKNLGEMESELDNQMFFRVNRQYIVNINFIRSFKSYERVKLQVELTLPEVQHVVIVSQETAPEFRKWIAGA